MSGWLKMTQKGTPAEVSARARNVRLQHHVYDTTLLLFQYSDVHFGGLWGTVESVHQTLQGVYVLLCTFFTAVICLYSNLYTYNASDCKCTIIRLHCATSKSSLWYMGYVPCGSATELPHIYRTNVYMYIAYIHVMHVHVYIYIYLHDVHVHIHVY